MVLYVLCSGVRFCTVLPSVCLDDIYSGLGGCVATFWERAANSVNHIRIYVRFKCCLCWWQGGCTGWFINLGISYCAPCLSERYSVSRVSRESYMSD